LYIAVALAAFGHLRAGLACAAILALFIGGSIVRKKYERRQSEMGCSIFDFCNSIRQNQTFGQRRF
jgi:hypothetical protein